MYFLGRRRTPVELTMTTAPAELADAQERARVALRLIHRHLTEQGLLEADDRDQVLVDVLLDLRNVLQPGVWAVRQRVGSAGVS